MKEELKSSLLLPGGFLNSSFSLAGLMVCNSYSHETCPGAAALQKTRELQECLFTCKLIFFLCLKAVIHQGSLSLPYRSKLDFTFVRCLMLSSRIFTGIASTAAEMNPFQGRTFLC